MSAEVMRVYVAWCEPCGWESGTDDFESQAERYAEKHNQNCPHASEKERDERAERDAWQAKLDQAMGATA